MKTKVKTKQPAQKQSASLSSRAMLVGVKISQWTARAVDKKATNTVVKAHKTTKEAGQYSKKLLPGATELDAVRQAAGDIRKYFYTHTLPWMTDGQRTLKSSEYINFSSEMRKMQGEFERAVAAFEKEYPRLQAEAKVKLGGLYSAAEYPAANAIKGKFEVSLDVHPLPDVEDFRVDISEAEKKMFVRKIKETETAAMRDAHERLRSVVHSAAEKLGQPDAIFRDSLIENVSEICKLLPSLNISDDADLEAMRVETEKLVGSLSADSLRADKSARTAAAKKLADLESKMSAFSGK